MWQHRLSEVNKEERTAICSTCGPTSLHLRGQGKFKCAGSKRNSFHGLTAQEAQMMKNNASCEICGNKDSLRIDHDHTTGVIRGVLCNNCNVALGLMLDNPETMRRAADYLETHEALIH